MTPARLRLAAFEHALRRFHEVLERPEDDVVRDASIQRFEFTFETAWRAVRQHALAEGVDCVSPRDCFRAGFRLGLIDKDALWIAMVEDRNRTTHAYDAETARKVYGALRGYAALFDTLLARLVEAERRRAAEERP